MTNPSEQIYRACKPVGPQTEQEWAEITLELCLVDSLNNIDTLEEYKSEASLLQIRNRIDKALRDIKE